MSSSRPDATNCHFRFLIRDASAEVLPALLNREAAHIRLYSHFPSPELCWWKVSVPLSRGGLAREVMVRGMEFDLELSTTEFLDWIDDFKSGGMTLIQCDRPLPADLQPRAFRRQETYLRVLGQLGARLLFELPHAHETAGVTLFHEEDVRRIEAAGIGLVPDRSA